MKTELEKQLRHIQQNPTTGTAHNQQVLTTQVETIFAIDGLKEEVKKLITVIEDSSKQSQKLEVSNSKVQTAMLALTVITTFIVVLEGATKFYAAVSPWVTRKLDNPGLASLLGGTVPIIIATFVAVFVYLKTQKTFLNEGLRLKDHLNIIKITNEKKNN